MGKFIDLTGQKFGRLIVIERRENSKWNKVQWFCKCECGIEKIIIGTTLNTWRTRSCGCYQKDIARVINTTHGLSSHSLYDVWTSMIDRCYNIKNKGFQDYGGRGILMSTKWRESFQFFYNDVIEGYEKGLQLDRKNNLQGYSSDNCRWVTSKENGRNTRSNIIISYIGEKHCLSEWCEILGLNYHSTYQRIYRYKWSIDKAFKI